MAQASSHDDSKEVPIPVLQMTLVPFFHGGYRDQSK